MGQLERLAMLKGCLAQYLRLLQSMTFTTRARLCEEVVLEAIERRGVVEPIPGGVLVDVNADLRRAAAESAVTASSVDRAMGFLNGALDTLLVLVRVADRMAA